MRDVAALAGVSLKTVSRVVNDEPGVSPDARSRVVDAVARLDYRHNLAASNLRRTDSRTGTIAALVQDVGNAYSAQLLRALEDTARAHRTAVVTASLDEAGQREEEVVHSLVTRRVDGLVLVPAADRQDYLASELRHGLPVVLVDRRGTGIDADSVTIDNVLGARRATDHLLAQGHRRIAALLDLESIRTASDRRAGYLEAYAGRGLPVDERLLHMDMRTEDEAIRVATDLLTGPEAPTAFFTGRNVLTVGVVRALQTLGRQHDVAVVGFDDFPLADLLDPPVTVIRQDVGRIGRTAAELLFSRIAGETPAPRHIVLAPTLIPRGSGEIGPPTRP